MARSQASWTTLRDLTARLNVLTGGPAPAITHSAFLENADAIVTHCEVNDHHGVGKLLLTLFQGDPNLLAIRSRTSFGGKHNLTGVALEIAYEEHTRDAVFQRILSSIDGHTVGRILCAPYFADDVRTAIALKEIFGAPLCTYLMDDQNIHHAGIPDALMGELLDKSRLRLAISPQLRTAYEQKYRLPFWYMPPVVRGGLIPSRLCIPSSPRQPVQGVVVGNIWGHEWLQSLRRTVRGSGVLLAWYSNGVFPCEEAALVADSIFPRRAEDEPLIETLRQTWFAVVPSGSLDDADDRQFLARLSLPSRIPFLLATSHIPILVLGDRRTMAAQFVEQFGVGVTSAYDTAAFRQTVDYLMDPEVNLAMRKRALALSGRFTDAGATEWIWQSLARERAADLRYEDLQRTLPE